LAQALVESGPGIMVSVSHTTRAPRPGEKHGTHYFFVSTEEFESMIAQDKFLEYARVFGNYYGTSREAVAREVESGHRVILDIDWQGMREIKAQWADAVSIFILPPSRAVLEQRLRDRGQDPDEIIDGRMREATSEMRHYQEFDYVVINDDFDLALADIQAIVGGRADQIRPMTADIKGLLAE
jgi:guanylate kinase